MKTYIRNLTLGVVTAMALISAAAQTVDPYPTKPLRIVVPFPPGGSIDMVARIIGQKLSDELKQAVIVDNRPGASGNIGMDHVAKSAPDGYTLVMAPFSIATNAHLFLKLPFDPLNDLAPIIRVADQPNVLIVNPDRVKAKSVAELISHLKANPGKLSFGTSGSGNPQDLSARVFMAATGTDMVNVAYKGGAPALADLVGGHIDLMFETAPTAVPYVKSGKLKALAVTSEKRLQSLPEIPTVAEAGVSGYKAVYWMGLLAPARTPPSVISKLNAATQKILATPDTQRQISDISLSPAGGTAAEFASFIRAESAAYSKLIKELNIPAQ
ncbi:MULTISPECIES: tripartite tricarboxylate transporter substrate binding protein [unclassified Acidovorax]|uniref:Bug family tripartite tricarboxylate transporter substrate binding protein n=1 Tax=unclassified Acidovorax TaxID=2684926 RepID=UPI001783B619|nr:MULTISPECIES: tripartite tricarboxylate transporter substrate binding protein [unclassified Acidovorax]MBD9394130.1 tripartite tricarboxylate transporter substrate binding protein [Acidovorax sp. ACV01]MBV7429372.1 tripartite tricarboxylate transporter substrate binding protein [Acidovorax sp. sif0732]MBV7451198.1 tripartite tricarboxylate transporter substrate binding protein [Acidovorax sp. sif0715]